ncbi:hypothetical protein ACFZDK_49815 [Streptomyces sp. NPDC007901]|uniref:hypothetical protein n=1 Tax=Streptomyces sp. NPDC007901 TaxID=3364785 RepID=UPI0036EE7E3F
MERGTTTAPEAEVVRERHRQVRVIGLLQPERVVPHIRIDVLLADKLAMSVSSASRTTGHHQGS